MAVVLSEPYRWTVWTLFGVVFCGLAANLYYTYVLSQSIELCVSSALQRTTLHSESDVPLSTVSTVDTTDSVTLDRHKRRAWRHRRQYNPEDRSGPSVEFFPKPQTTEQSGDHVWLTSYSRIPLPVLKEYCFSAKEYCPKGDPGPPGNPGNAGLKGDKGDRGDRGIPGEAGPRGPAGTPGYQGPVGPPGDGGSPGLDGRDGLPGYPGLDGVPGRDGIDGISGKDGIPGIPGTPGKSGTNGTNGIPGSPGGRGPIGPQGPAGLSGPRGRKGIPGKPGTPGVPGMNTWKINGSQVNELLIPPSIVDVEQQTTVMVQEGENVRLKCAATGAPPPEISWRKDATTPILLGSTYMTAIKGDRINFTRVIRDQMGVYMCIASNGIPPPAFKKIRLEVSFPPLIKIRNQMVGTRNGSYAALECFVEAFPQAVNYWLYGDGRLLEASWKYVMKQEEDTYKNHIVLNITYIEPTDYGMYKCVSKNEKGTTLGVFTVFEIDPTVPTRSPQESTFTVYGQAPPIIEPEQPQCTPCPDCPTQQRCTTRGQGKLDSFRIENVYDSFDFSNWKLYPRNKNCVISQIGKPVFSRYTDTDYGSWMQDANPKGTEDEAKYWVTLDNDHDHLYEYANKTLFRENNHTMKHGLPYTFHGNGHIIYNGSFYYHRQSTDQLVRFDIKANISKFVELGIGSFNNEGAKLYTIRHNYIDLAADENGLWVILAGNKTNNTIIKKFHSYTLQTEYMWRITLDHHNIGEMFITCGVLYIVDSVVDRNTQITYAVDLYRNKIIEPNLDFSNPFRQNNMVAYNPKHEIIVTWDKGNQLSYPVKFGTLDLGQPDADEPDH